MYARLLLSMIPNQVVTFEMYDTIPLFSGFLVAGVSALQYTLPPGGLSQFLRDYTKNAPLAVKELVKNKNKINHNEVFKVFARQTTCGLVQVVGTYFSRVYCFWKWDKHPAEVLQDTILDNLSIPKDCPFFMDWAFDFTPNFLNGATANIATSLVTTLLRVCEIFEGSARPMTLLLTIPETIENLSQTFGGSLVLGLYMACTKVIPFGLPIPFYGLVVKYLLYMFFGQLLRTQVEKITRPIKTFLTGSPPPPSGMFTSPYPLPQTTEEPDNETEPETEDAATATTAKTTIRKRKKATK